MYGRELTPKGECLKAYLNKIEQGSEDHIVPYDEYVYRAQSLLKERHNIELDYMETVNLMTSYFSEYF